MMKRRGFLGKMAALFGLSGLPLQAGEEPTQQRGEPIRRPLKSYRSYRAFWYDGQEGLPKPWPFINIVITNAGYARTWRIPWSERGVDPQRFFERFVDAMVESYERHGNEAPVPLDHDVDWKGEPCDFRVEGES